MKLEGEAMSSHWRAMKAVTSSWWRETPRTPWVADLVGTNLYRGTAEVGAAVQRLDYRPNLAASNLRRTGARTGLIGALVGMGIPEYEAKRYEGHLKTGGVLLSVHCDTADEITEKQKASVEKGLAWLSKRRKEQ
mgnify:CR=1 FL=1